MNPGERAVRFINALRHVKGEWAGQPFRLRPWQEHFVRELFGTLRPDGLRQYRTASLWLGRKNGKTSLAAAIALYLLVGDGEPGAEVILAACDKDQASLVFDIAVGMVRQSPYLSGRLKVVPSTKRIVDPQTGSYLRAIPADAAGSHGFNAHGDQRTLRHHTPALTDLQLHRIDDHKRESLRPQRTLVPLRHLRVQCLA